MGLGCPSPGLGSQWLATVGATAGYMCCCCDTAPQFLLLETNPFRFWRARWGGRRAETAGTWAPALTPDDSRSCSLRSHRCWGEPGSCCTLQTSISTLYKTSQSSEVLRSSAIINLIPIHMHPFSEKLIKIPPHPLPSFAFSYMFYSEKLLGDGNFRRSEPA